MSTVRACELCGLLTDATLTLLAPRVIVCPTCAQLPLTAVIDRMLDLSLEPITRFPVFPE